MENTQSIPSGNSIQKNETKRHSLHFLIFIFLCVVALIIALWIVQTSVMPFRTSSTQAVFLTNGQVYFGHLEKSLGGKYIRLKNVYYLQVNQQLQDTATETNTNTSTVSPSDLSLAKLGQEIHGPKDTMLINRDHIMFIEELNDSSQVVQAIADFEEEK